MASNRRFTPGHTVALFGALSLLAASGGPALAQDTGSTRLPGDPAPAARQPADGTVLGVCRGDLVRPDARREAWEGATADGLAEGRTFDVRSPYATWFVEQLRRSAEQVFVPAAPPPLYPAPAEPEVRLAKLHEELAVPAFTPRAWPTPPGIGG